MIRLKRQLHLRGLSVADAPTHGPDGQAREATRIVLSAVNEDLVEVAGYGSLARMGGYIEFVKRSVAEASTARSTLTFVPPTADAPPSFRIEFDDVLGFQESIGHWHPPIELWLELDPPAEPSIDPTDPWIWDVVRFPTLKVRGVSMNTLGGTELEEAS